MPASGEAYGEDSVAAHASSPTARKERAQLSGIAYGEDENHGFAQAEPPQDTKPFDPNDGPGDSHE